MPKLDIRLFKPNELIWSYNHEKPYYNLTDRSYEWVDPMPGYAHDITVVRAVAGKCQEIFPPVTDMKICLTTHESDGRTNGWSQKDWYGDKPWLALVSLSGKRIPIHPAMSRYVTAHEYGHHVQWWLEHQRGLEEGDLRNEYYELRGRGVQNISGIPGHWHHAVGEVFACDFRILGAGIEEEYWPHPGIKHPLELDETHPVRQWWKEVLQSIG